MDDSSADEQLRLKPRPIEEVLPSAELLAHYKGRIGEFRALLHGLYDAKRSCMTRLYLLPADQFEQERDELLAAVDRCAVHRDDVHRLEWENRKRADEIKELQKVSAAAASAVLGPMLAGTMGGCAANSACWQATGSGRNVEVQIYPSSCFSHVRVGGSHAAQQLAPMHATMPQLRLSAAGHGSQHIHQYHERAVLTAGAQ